MDYSFDDKTKLDEVREFRNAVREFKKLSLHTIDINPGLYSIITDVIINSSIIDLSWQCHHFGGLLVYYESLIKIAKCNQLVSLEFTNASLLSMDVYPHLTVSKLCLHVSITREEYNALKNNRYIIEFCLPINITSQNSILHVVAKQNRDRINNIRQKCLILLNLPVYRDIRILLAKYVWYNRYFVP